MGRFQLHQLKGAKNAKKEESESFLKQKVKRLCKKESKALVTRHEPTCISAARGARIGFCSLKLSLSSFLAFLAPLPGCS